MKTLWIKGNPQENSADAPKRPGHFCLWRCDLAIHIPAICTIAFTSLLIGGHSFWADAQASPELPAQGNVYVGERLTSGYGMGVNTSEGMTRWVRDRKGYMECNYPAGQEWGAVFITAGEPTEESERRRTVDASSCDYLIIDLKGAAGGEQVSIGVKTADDADDGTEPKYLATGLTKNWQTYEIPLYEFCDNANFPKTRLNSLYVVCELVFETNTPPERIFFRNVHYGKCDNEHERLNLALMTAIRADDLDAVKSLLEKGADIKARDPDGNTCLINALKFSEDPKIVELLITRGADVNAGNKDGMTALIGAVGNQNALDLMRLLLERGAHVNTRAKGGITALAVAAAVGDADKVQMLLDNHADIRAKLEYGVTVLMIGAMYGKTDVVQLLLDKGVNIKARTEDGSTALMFAALADETEAAALLLEKGADINAVSKHGLTALLAAASCGQEDTVRLLLEKGADVKAGISSGSALLIACAAMEDASIIEQAVDKGVDIHAFPQEGLAALLVASGSGNVDIVKFLLDKGISVNGSLQGITPLMMAALQDQTEVVQLLLENGADAHAKSMEGVTALMAGALFGNVDTLKLLLDRGAEVNSKTQDGVTALMVATMLNNTKKDEADIVNAVRGPVNKVRQSTGSGKQALADTDPGKLLAETDIGANSKKDSQATQEAEKADDSAVEFLLDQGADPNAMTNQGVSALMVAALIGHTDVIKLLLDKRADPNVKTNDGVTPLMAAAFTGNTEGVQLLLDKKADPNATTSDGTSALMLAVLSGANEGVEAEPILDFTSMLGRIVPGVSAGDSPADTGSLIKLLLEKGANVNTRNKAGQTALTWAKMVGNTDIVQILMQAGAKE